MDLNSKNTISYVDPNNIASYNAKNEKFNDNVYWNPEDLFVSVDIQVVIPDRDNCGRVDYANPKTFFLKPKQSFFSGTALGKDEKGNDKDHYLTTSFTDISFSEVEGNKAGNSETLCVDSIDIGFDSHFFPQVTIKFVDVRGASLMMPEEQNYLESEKERLTKGEYKKTGYKNLFKSLFHFPYPVFYLTVKGFYGTRETFMLSVEDFKSSFNSSTGNFDVTVKFIGNMYGIYSDLPFNYLIVAPYIGGTNNQVNNYWESNRYLSNGKSGGKFTFADGTPIPTFLEFIKKYDEIDKRLTDALRMNGNDFQNVKSVIELRRDNYSLNEILRLKSEFDGALNRRFSESEANAMVFDNEDYIILLKKTGGTVRFDAKLFESICKKYFDYEKNKKEKIEGRECLRYFEENPEIITVEPIKLTISNGVISYTPSQYFDGFVLNDKNEKLDINSVLGDSTVHDKIKDGFEYCVIYKKFEKEGEFFDNIRKKAKENLSAISENIEKNNDEYRELSKNVLGFVPTLENVFRMIYAHIDCYMHEFYNTLGNVLGEWDSRSTGKLIPNVDIQYTDMETLKDSSVNLPPFTGFYEIDSDTKQRVKAYPFKYKKSNGERLSEIYFVEKLYNGLASLPTDLETTDKKNNVSPSVEEIKQNFIPLYPLDVLYNGENPYKYIETSERQEGYLDEILRAFIYRIAIGLETKSLSYRSIFSVDELKGEKTLVKNEAKNIISALSDEKKQVLVKEIEKYYNIITDTTAGYGPFNNKRKNYVYDILRGGGLNMEVEPVQNYFVKVKTPSTLSKTVWEMRNKDSNVGLQTLQGSHPVKDISILDKNELLFFDNKEWLYGNVGVVKKIEQNDDGTEKDVLCSDYSKTVNSLINTYDSQAKAKYEIDVLPYYRKKSIENLYYAGILPNDKYKRAQMFLSTIVGDCSAGAGMALIPSETRISRLPKFLELFLGSEFKFQNDGISVDKHGHFNNFEEIPKKIQDYTINQLKSYYPKAQSVFEEWVKNGGFEYDIDHYLSQSPEKIGNKECYTDKKIKRLLLEFYLKNEYYLQVSLKPENSVMEINFSAISKLIDELKRSITEISNESTVETENVESTNAEKDAESLKEEIYYSQKGLYDKWLSTFTEERFWLKNPEADKKIAQDKANGMSVSDTISEFNNFVFMDSFYNNIGQTFYIDAAVLHDILVEQINQTNARRSNRSTLEFIGDIADRHKLLFIALPVYNNFYSPSTIVNIFKPHGLYNDSDGGQRNVGNTYLLMYTHETSHNLGESKEYKNGVKYEDDGVDIADTTGMITEEAAETFIKGNMDKYTIPAFGVTFGKQNQSYFKDIEVNMENPRQTDFAIYNQFKLAAQEKRGDVNSPITLGQNMFSIYSNRCYDCHVTMLGCANIMPTMYFQLNNIPLFKGAYMITKVEHSIRAGVMETKFSGTRISKNAVPYLKCPINMEELVRRITGGNSVNIDNEVSAGNNETTFDESQMLSQYFSLRELVHSDYAEEHGIKNIPSEEIIKNLRELAVFLDGLREYVGYGINVNSGYRSVELNRELNGVDNSAHLLGFAADLRPEGTVSMRTFKTDVLRYLVIEKKKKGFDQCIMEHSGSAEWVHLGLYCRGENGLMQRGQFLEYIASNAPGKRYPALDFDNYDLLA